MNGFRRRTRLFIVKGFQARYISLILLCVFATAILSGYTVYVTTWHMLGAKLAAVYPQGLLLDIVKKVNMVLLLRLVFLTPIVVFIGLVLSNRIAGPVYRIQQYLKKVSEGSYKKRLKLRKKDEFKDVAEALNDFVDKLRLDRDRCKEKINALLRETDEMEKAVAADGGGKEKLLAKILELKGEIDSLV